MCCSNLYFFLFSFTDNIKFFDHYVKFKYLVSLCLGSNVKFLLDLFKFFSSLNLGYFTDLVTDGLYMFIQFLGLLDTATFVLLLK